jgi:diketogulonate reductase-like aldo/keto reductase
MAKQHGKTPEQIFFRFIQSKGMIPLSGTTNPVHMREDLEVKNIHLEAAEIAAIDGLIHDKTK